MDHPVETEIRTKHFNYETNAKENASSHYFLARAINQNNCQPQAIIPNDWQIPETQIVRLAETTIGNKEILSQQAEANKAYLLGLGFEMKAIENFWENSGSPAANDVLKSVAKANWRGDGIRNCRRCDEELELDGFGEVCQCAQCPRCKRKFHFGGRDDPKCAIDLHGHYEYGAVCQECKLELEQEGGSCFDEYRNWLLRELNDDY